MSLYTFLLNFIKIRLFKVNFTLTDTYINIQWVQKPTKPPSDNVIMWTRLNKCYFTYLCQIHQHRTGFQKVSHPQTQQKLKFLFPILLLVNKQEQIFFYFSTYTEYEKIFLLCGTYEFLLKNICIWNLQIKIYQVRSKNYMIPNDYKMHFYSSTIQPTHIVNLHYC